MKTITIFTPTYNRAYILPQLYASLRRQTSDDFVWLIVDDGSTDGTRELVASWNQESEFEIRYYLQENRGKMQAHNVGVEMCETPLFFCVDSDDYLTDNAVERICDVYSSNNQLDSYCGIIGYKLMLNDGHGAPLTRFKSLESSSLHDLYRKGFRGDTSLVFRTEVIKQYPFPYIEGEKFITESYVYEQIDVKYKYLLADEGFMVCEYREDGYTQNIASVHRKNPKGYAMYWNQHLQMFWGEKNAKERMRDMMMFIIFYKLGGGKHAYRDCGRKSLYFVPAYLLQGLYKRKLFGSNN